MRFFHARKRDARFLNPARLRKAGDIDSCSPRHSSPLLKGNPACGDGIVVASGHVVTDSHPHMKDRVLWIVRTHAKRLLKMDHRVVRLSVKGERPTKIAVSGRKVRIEL